MWQELCQGLCKPISHFPGSTSMLKSGLLAGRWVMGLVPTLEYENECGVLSRW